MQPTQKKQIGKKERKEKKRKKAKRKTEFSGCRTTFNLSKCIMKHQRRGIQMAHGQKSSDADPLRRRMTHSSLGTCMKKDFLAEASDFHIRHPIREILVREVSKLYCDRGWRICPPCAPGTTCWDISRLGEIPFLYWQICRPGGK